MPGSVLSLDELISADEFALQIARKYWEWYTRAREARERWVEIRDYVYATSTRQTTNSKLPWKNSTTIPKLCQIRDNLYSNYTKSLFPKRKWLTWEGEDEQSSEATKRQNIENYMQWVVSRSGFRQTIEKLLLDWIDTGNCFAMPDWEDETIVTEEGTKVGYVGPKAVRISPLDLVFDPLAPSFAQSPKIVRSFVSLGELKEMLEGESAPEYKEEKEALWNYLKDLRYRATNVTGTIEEKDDFFKVDGFGTFRDYLEGEYAEILTFYGDIYDIHNDTFYKNYVITVVDRHKIIGKRPIPSMFGRPPIYHTGWRPRQDNLWAMGPLENLVGMQYRLDHIENMKADIFDLTSYPVLKITGYVDDFEWQPGERIICSEEGNVEMVVPDVQALNANLELAALEQKMEEMAGAPKEALGFRTPGEKTKYEVQRLENAASRIFMSRLLQFEAFMEELLSGMLEVGRRNMSRSQIRVEDEEFNTSSFLTLSAIDISGNGRLRPMAASHFAEKAEKIQNLAGFYNSVPGQDPAVQQHFSGVKLAEMYEELLEIEGFDLVTPYIRITEQAEAERLSNTQLEQTMMESQTETGLTPEDFSDGAIQG